jgi:hypothetical protein
MVPFIGVLIVTFGLSRLLLYVISRTLPQRTRIIWANLGYVVALAGLYAVMIGTDRGDRPGGEAVAAWLLLTGIATACQGLWFWLDHRKLPFNRVQNGQERADP